MKKAILMINCCLILLIPCVIFAEDAQEMMGQYKQMSEGTSANFPKELEVLMPKGFTIATKGFVFKETANMFLFVALTGTRKNDAYPKFGHEATVEISVMAYNPQSASYMESQMPVVMQESKKGYGKGIINEGAGWEISPVKVSKFGQADLFIQKGVRKNVEIDNNKQEDQTYYFANVVTVNKNSLLNIRLIYYPLKGENAEAAVKEITKVFLATNFNKYMK